MHGDGYFMKRLYPFSFFILFALLTGCTSVSKQNQVELFGINMIQTTRYPVCDELVKETRVSETTCMVPMEGERAYFVIPAQKEMPEGVSKISMLFPEKMSDLNANGTMISFFVPEGTVHTATQSIKSLLACKYNATEQYPTREQKERYSLMSKAEFSFWTFQVEQAEQVEWIVMFARLDEDILVTVSKVSELDHYLKYIFL